MNPRLDGIAPSLIRAIAAKRKPSSIDLGLGEPTLRPELRFFETASAWVAKNGCPYTANSGDIRLREHIAHHYDYPQMNDAANVCITSGSQEALYASITALLDPAHDELLIVEPVFGSYAKIAELAGVTVQTVAMEGAEGFAFDVELILGAITTSTRMIAICSPCNPTGRVMRRAQAEQLAAALLARSGPPILVLFDEVYRELCYVEDAASFARYYPHTIAINSLSKSNALTGLRLGWAIAPGGIIESIVKLHSWATSAASTFAQQVALAIFTEPGAITAQHAWYRARAAQVARLLAEYAIESTPVEGAFYSLLRFPRVEKSLEAALFLAEHEDVLMIPGIAFGPVSEAWLRVSWVAEWDALEKGILRAHKLYA